MATAKKKTEEEKAVEQPTEQAAVTPKDIQARETPLETTAAEVVEPADSDADNEPESLAALANRHRVPAWQQAALLRFMGWADGKMLTDAEYKSALAELSARRLGGGRR